jgi:hypothetical protein
MPHINPCPRCGEHDPQRGHSEKVHCGACGKFLGFDPLPPVEDHVEGSMLPMLYPDYLHVLKVNGNLLRPRSSCDLEDLRFRVDGSELHEKVTHPSAAVVVHEVLEPVAYFGQGNCVAIHLASFLRLRSPIGTANPLHQRLSRYRLRLWCT